MLTGSKPSAQFPYVVEDKIGEGAMGEVYRAIETSLGRKVAIKILRQEFLGKLAPDKAHEAEQRFLQEARAAASLSHPGITTIYRVGVESGVPYIAMEWLEGLSLDETLQMRSKLPAGEVAHLGVELLETLFAAHTQGVIHRDIKPGNIMLLADGRLKIADFGVARVAGSKLVQTQAGSILGTPFYASPEQVRGVEVDVRADIYSASVVLYQALTGYLPYDTSNIVELVHCIISDESAPPPERYDPQVPANLSAIIQTGMSKDRSRRFATATQMAAALRQFLANHPGARMDQRRGRLSRLPSSMMSGPRVDEVLAPTVLVDGTSPVGLVSGLIERWPSKPLGRLKVASLVERLLERPLHVAPFAGAARVGPAIFLVHGGMIYAIFDPQTGVVSDAVYEDLPEKAVTTLYPVPDALDSRVAIALASLVHPRRTRHAELDSSFADLIQLTSKLINDKFDGALRFEYHGELAFLLLDQGRPLLHMFSGGWPTNPQEHSWPTWVADLGVTACVDERRVVLSAISYRRELASFEFSVKIPKSGPGGATLTPAEGAASAGRGHDTMTVIYGSAPMFNFLSWMIEKLPEFFAERDRTKKWKYLASWVPLIERAILHHRVPRPGSGVTDDFDLVTLENQTRVLHLAHRVEHGSAQALQDFVDRVLATKRARIKTGDVGGACLVAPSFDGDAIALYEKLTSHEEKKSFFFSLQDSVTGYEGFVRLGTTRGFHLLLVQETNDGFKPILS